MHTFIFFVVTLLVLVTVHEFGHYIVARLCGVRVLTFSVGFGKPLLQWVDRAGTRFVLAAIPLGGYVKMLDEREGSVPEALLPSTFNRASSWSKLAIVSAGPIINIVFAVLLYWLIFIVGVNGVKPLIGDIAPGSVAEQYGFRSGEMIVAIDGRETVSRADVRTALLKRIGESGNLQLQLLAPESTTPRTISLSLDDLPASSVGADSLMPTDILSAMGVSFWFPPLAAKLDQVVEDGAAYQAGLRAGDTVRRIGDQPIESWQQLVETVRPAPRITKQFEVLRGEQVLRFEVYIAPYSEQQTSGDVVEIGRIGVSPEWVEFPPELLVTQRWTVLGAMPKALGETLDTTVFTIESIGKMVMGLISTDNLSGPLTIAKYAGASAETSVMAYVQFLALLSISLGVLNLLPIPILDGGQIIMIATEALRGRPLPEQWVMRSQQIGMLLLFSLMSLAIYNDFARM